MVLFYRVFVVVILVFVGKFIYGFLVLTEKNAKDCSVEMLDYFGGQISSSYEKLVNEKYSSGFSITLQKLYWRMINTYLVGLRKQKLVK